MNNLHAVPGCRVEKVINGGSERIGLAVHGLRSAARCPDCGCLSRSVHSTYHRRPADLPSLGQEVRLILRVRRFYCPSEACSRRTFAERLPGLLIRHAQRTRRLAGAQGLAGVATGGEAGARLLGCLGMPASADTVLRLVRGLPLPRRKAPRRLGVDDWAIRKGRTYGTILIDLDERRPVDLLPDRRAATLAAWLRSRPGIEIVARDRSTEYGRGIVGGAPQAVQVADRWHLLLNTRQMLERWLAGVHARLRRLPDLAAPANRPVRRGAFPRGPADRASSAGSRARWLAAHEEVRRRFAAGQKLLAISRAMRLARATVRRYAYAESFPERATRAPGLSILDPHLAHLEGRLAAGCENAMALWRELRARGFAGTHRQVHRWLQERRTVPARSTARRQQDPTRNAAPSQPRRSSPIPSPKQLAWLVVQPPDTLSERDAAAVARATQDAEAARVVALARRFGELVRNSGVGRRAERRRKPTATFQAWLADAGACGIRAVATFAGLQQDGAAIQAALTMPWSNGQAEGQIIRLKLLKRQMYGRAGFDLLRQRVLLAT